MFADEKMTSDQQRKFKYWQNRTLMATIIGYAVFYLVRKNLSMALPGIQSDLGISKAELGIFLTLHGVIYGVSKFANGFVADRLNARSFMVFGLIMCAACNIVFGFGSTVMLFGLLWIFNGFFQGMGFPPCARLLTHWIPTKEFATKMSIWNASHSIGAALVFIICGYVISISDFNIFGFTIHGWRWCFIIPSLIALAGAGFLWITLRDKPSSVGLPELPGTIRKPGTVKKDAEYQYLLRKKLFGSPAIWILGIANFFSHVVRGVILDWGPTILHEWQNLPMQQSGWVVACFEIAGIAGGIAAGWATDRFFGGRGPRVCVICMLLTSLFIVLFLLTGGTSLILSVACFSFAGFFIYGPHALAAITAAKLATRKVAGAATGFMGLFAYLSTLVSGVLIGWLTDLHGWGFTLGVVAGAGVISAVIFLFIWKTKADGYEENIS